MPRTRRARNADRAGPAAGAVAGSLSEIEQFAERILHAAVLREFARRSGALRKNPPRALMFEQQLRVVDDQARFKALLCGGRAGKTSTMIFDFADGMALDPHTPNLYVGQTRTSAEDIFWRPFCLANDTLGWGFKTNETKKLATHPNGSWLLCAGADDRRELEKRRGTPWKRVRIDECGAQRPSYLKYFVEQVIEPRLMDHNGDLWLAGTPGITPAGYFFEVTTGKVPGYSVHKWTAKDNPHVDFEKFVYEPVKGLLARRGWTEDNPIFQREYLAEWSVDTERLVYRFARERNAQLRALPKLQRGARWVYVLAFDFGFGDATAWAVLAYSAPYGNTVYVVESGRVLGKAPSEVATLIEALRVKYRPSRMVGDVNGLGKGYAVEYALRFGHVIEAADKKEKRASLEVVSDMLFTGLLQSISGANDALENEWATVVWDEEREDVAPGQDDDVSDAAMYGAKICPAFLQRREAPMPDPTPTWARDPGPEDDKRERRKRKKSYLWTPDI
jgi:hypothetical protein